MSRTIRIGAVASAVLLALALGAPGSRAQDGAAPAAGEAAAAAVDPNAVVARIGEMEVTEKDIQFASEAFAAELANVPEAERRSVTIDAFVNMQLLARAAEDAGLDKSAEFAERLEFMRLQTLRNLYVTKEIMDSLTDEELQEGYETLVLAQHTPEEQVRARHILVETKEEAEKIIADLDAGGSFEELAKQSKDPSGQNGGDLGFFGKGQMVPPFEAAAFALEPGAVTAEPVESQFGWHVIKVEEKRMSAPPALSEVEPQLRSFLMRKKFETALTALRDKYSVEIVGAPEAETAPAEAAPAEGEAAEGEAEKPAN